MKTIADNLASIRDTMQHTAIKAGRKASDVRLVAVSKTKDVACVRQALAAGQTIFGENRVQEAASKFIDMRREHPELELHLIGPLQTNKIDTALALFDVIETLDRPRLADALAKSINKLGRAPRLYIEVNIGQEPQKAGILPEALPEFLNYCRDRGLKIEGLMCIPPHTVDPVSFFQRMKNMADQHKLPHLSMGMSGDFEQAIACGATEVRVGSAIFGERTVLDD